MARDVSRQGGKILKNKYKIKQNEKASLKRVAGTIAHPALLPDVDVSIKIDPSFNLIPPTDEMEQGLLFKTSKKFK